MRWIRRAEAVTRSCRASPIARPPHEVAEDRREFVERSLVLAKTIGFLKSQSDRYDTAMLYVSDHGESLGENNLFLHGMPYAIAPKEQTHVPMVMWFSDSYASSRGIDLGCLRFLCVC